MNWCNSSHDLTSTRANFKGEMETRKRHMNYFKFECLLNLSAMFGQICYSFEFLWHLQLLIWKNIMQVYFGFPSCLALGSTSVLCLVRNTMWWVNRNQETAKEIDCLREELHFERGAQPWTQEAAHKVVFSFTEIRVYMQHMY